jgi:hypothetical protein
MNDQRFWDSQGALITDFLTEQRTINAAYYSKLLKDQLNQPFVQNYEVNQSKACLLHNARPH